MVLSKHWLARAASCFSGLTLTSVHPGRTPQKRAIACIIVFNIICQSKPWLFL
jgi:hypothetical protein